MAKVVERFDIFKGLYICKYDNSSNWDIKTRIDKKTRRFATGTPEREKAVALATEKYYEIKTKISLGISPESKGFKAVAEEVIEDLQLNVSNGIKVKTSKIYISAIKMYHIPFFKELPFNAITQKLIKDHNKWKMHIRGEEFFSSTLKNHNAALQKVFDRAIQHGHMAAYQRPELASEGRSQQRRAHFSTQELDILDGAFNKKIERSKSEDEERFWILLYIYTEFLLYTGIRTGEELNNIRWKDISVELDDGIPNVSIAISKGKTTLYTGTRIAIGRDDLINSVFGLIQLYPNRIGEDKIFILPKDKSIDSFSRAFSQLLNELGLKHSSLGERSLYSYRHTYILFSMLSNIDDQTIATQCGTSVDMLSKNYKHTSSSMFIDKLTGIDRQKKKVTPFDKTVLSEGLRRDYYDIGKQLEKNFRERGYV